MSGVHRIAHRRVFNCYLVVEDDGLTLVDTGPAGAVQGILDRAHALRAPIRRIVLTHAHADHVAGVDQLVGRLGDGVEIIAGRREAPILAGDLSLLAGEPEPAPKPRSYGAVDVPLTRLVDDQDHIGSLVVLDTPGHTPGHISLLDPRTRTLIAGDAVLTQGRVAVSGDLVLRWPFPAFSTWNRPLAVESARRLLAQRPSRLATGHGPVIEDATAALGRAVARARARGGVGQVPPIHQL
jgi:glyoxylase-like metal-dependent hydrolase (beta-lactamase superfamily II)